jgi:hypothetical protein
METEEEESQDSKEEPHQIGDNVEMLEIDIPSLNAKHGESHLSKSSISSTTTATKIIVKKEN